MVCKTENMSTERPTNIWTLLLTFFSHALPLLSLLPSDQLDHILKCGVTKLDNIYIIISVDCQRRGK